MKGKSGNEKHDTCNRIKIGDENWIKFLHAKSG